MGSIRGILKVYLSSSFAQSDKPRYAHNQQLGSSAFIRTTASRAAAGGIETSTQFSPSPKPKVSSIPHTMCRASAFKSHGCQHRWLTITMPCSPGTGFDNCPRHTFNSETAFFGGPKFCWAPIHCCPVCGKRNQYDGNRTRMILKNRTDVSGAGGACASGGDYTYSQDEYGVGRKSSRRGGYGRSRRAEAVCCVVM